MTDTTQLQRVERVLALTVEIEEAAALSDWERAARVTEERSPLLRSIAATDDPAILARIRRIQDLDAARLRDAHLAQSQLSAEFGGAVSNIRAASLYQRVARF
ncbi:flagellar protein FliT [Paraburkholderia sp. J41]|uniref:flagellar protein FliT n=1 Tax=Paraburkholderia sp. J41 TaxID=2805433 RepID=UPI002AC3465D|nr:flagellar protein FliT [Paraburkholderia sp. J41]